MNTLKLNKYGKVIPIVLMTEKYVDNDNLAIEMISIDREPWSTLTVNLGTKCANNCAFIDINNNGNEILDWLVKNKLGKPTGKTKGSGWVVYPEFEFDMNVVAQYIREDCF